MGSLQVCSRLDASADVVWARLVTPAGINDELWPWLTMELPGAIGASLDEVPLDQPLGRAPLRLFGRVRIDHDDLLLTVLEPGHRFREVSSTRLFRRWEHQRTVTAGGDGTSTVLDEVRFTPRVAGPVLDVVLGPVVLGLFRWRHRRLRHHHGRGRAPGGL